MPNNCPQIHRGGPNVICYYFDCWTGYFKPPTAVDTNTANFPGLITNNCSFTLYNVAITFKYETSNCGGVSSAPTSNIGYAPNPIPGYYTKSFVAGDTGYCETCHNGVAFAWPSFNLEVYLEKVIGYDAPSGANRNAYEEYNLDATNIYMPNSSRYSFPCP